VPNGGSRHPLEAARLKREGVTPGVADLMLLVQNATYGALFIEMKQGKGKQTEAQKTFEIYCQRRGYLYKVCRTFDEFYCAVEVYLHE
jgi:hypothetical protein